LLLVDSDEEHKNVALFMFKASLKGMDPIDIFKISNSGKSFEDIGSVSLPLVLKCHSLPLLTMSHLFQWCDCLNLYRQIQVDYEFIVDFIG